MRKFMAAAIVFGALGSAANAADLGHAQIYHPHIAPAGDPVYANHSIVTGDVSFSGGVLGYNDGDHTPWGAGGGRATFDLASGAGLTLEVGAQSWTRTLMGYGHVFKRLPGAAIGLYGGVGVVGGTGGVELGVEGITEISPNLHLGGEAGIVVPVEGGDSYGVGGVSLTYWHSPYTKVRGDIYVVGDRGWGHDLGGSVTLAHQFNGGPIVGYGRAGFRTVNDQTDGFLLAGGTIIFNPGATMADHYARSPFKSGYRLVYFD